jgi:predicted AAA+ superfamily ATPase
MQGKEAIKEAIMPAYKSRQAEKKLKQYAKYFKVVLVTGARQVGKSTLLQHLFPEYKCFIFDPIQDLYGARRDPDLFLDTFPPPLVLDEIQFAPELLPAIKRRVDTREQQGQYFLTGSQNLSVLKSVAESLAGRVGIINLEGMTIQEMSSRPEDNWLAEYLQSPAAFLKLRQEREPVEAGPLAQTLWRGSLPGILEMPNDIVAGYFRSYIQTYVERDVRLLENIRELSSFDRFLGLSAALCAQEINASQLGREIGVTPATSRRWLDLLENTFQWLEVFPYHGNTIKRISGKRKGYWRDTGLACYLQRLSSPDALAVSPLLGSMFETWVVNQLYRLSSLLPTPPQLYHWRTSGGAEVDLILALDGCLFPLEIKCKTSLTGHDARGLRAFRETYPQEKIAPALIIYAGRESCPLDQYTTAIPWNI